MFCSKAGPIHLLGENSSEQLEKLKFSCRTEPSLTSHRPLGKSRDLFQVSWECEPLTGLALAR